MSSMEQSNNVRIGFSLIEVIIGIAILASILVASGLAVTGFVDARAQLVDDTVTLYLAEEGYELLRAIRENDWDELSVLTIGDTYYLDVAAAIDITTTPEVIDGTFTRSFVVDRVSRDSDDDIVPNGTSGSSVDGDVLQATVTVVGPTGTQTVTGILTNIYAI